MSPVGLDVREYQYGVTQFTVPDVATYTATTRGEWLVTRVQAWAAEANGGGLVLFGDAVNLEPGGCIELLPGGAFRGDIVLLGEGLIVVFEYWYQSNAARGNSPLAVVIT